jgi:hypothetical protein
MSRFLSRAAFAVAALAVASHAQTVSIFPTADNTLYENAVGALSNGAGASMFTGRTGAQGAFKARRAVLKFDVAAAVPAGHEVIYAELRIHCTQLNGAPAQVKLHRLTSDWGEGTSDAGFPGGGGAPSTTGDATWIHTFFATSTWTTSGGDYVPTFSAKATVDSINLFTWGPTAELTADVRDMRANPALNYGWILVAPEVANQAQRFETRESVGFEPVLFIIYAPAIPATKTLVGAGCSGTNPLPYTLDASGLPVLGDDFFYLSFVDGPPNGTAFLFLSSGTGPPLAFGGGCNVYLDLVGAGVYFSLGLSPIGPITLDGAGVFYLPIPLPPEPLLSGFPVASQAFAYDGASPIGFILSNALQLVLGT